MMLKITNKNIEYKIKLNGFTQMCGLDFTKKDFILDSITKYFTNSKYQEYEENMIDNIYLENGEQLGKNYFKIIRINTRNDLVDFVKISKGSIFKEYIDNELNNYDYQSYIENIRDLLEKIYLSINKNIMQEIGKIRIDFKSEELLNIIHKSEINNVDDKPIEENSNMELLKIVLELVKGIQKQNPCKILLIIKDIDHLISKNEYDILYDKIISLISETNTYFLSTISMNNFAILNLENIDSVNIVNDIIFQIDNFDRYKEFIINNYPINIDISDNELLKLTNMILQYIGYDGFHKDLRADVILKLLDDSMSINIDSKTKINNIEISFLNS